MKKAGASLPPTFDLVQFSPFGVRVQSFFPTREIIRLGTFFLLESQLALIPRIDILKARESLPHEMEHTVVIHDDDTLFSPARD